MSKPKPQTKKKATKTRAAGNSASAAGKGYKPTRYVVWHYFKRGSLENLPPAVLPKILKLTQFETIDALHEELSRHNRFELPDELQDRIANLFDIRINRLNSEEWDSYILTPTFDGAELELPFPFKASPDVIFKTQVLDFSIDQDKKRQGITAFIKMQVSTDDSIIPRRPEDEKFCKLFESGDLDVDGSDKAVGVIADWLSSNGIQKRTAMCAAADEDFREDLDHRLQMGVEYLIVVSGSQQLGKGLILNLEVAGIELVP